MALDTRLLTNLKGAIILLHFDPIRIECLSHNRWGNAIRNRSSLSSHLDETVNGIELVANIEEQAEAVFQHLSKFPSDNYSGLFKLHRPDGAVQELVFNASVAEHGLRHDIKSCLCVILDVTKDINSIHASTSDKGKISINTFSRREQEVIREMMNGLTSKEIGEKLFITENTVETHRGRIFKKAGVRNVVGLVSAVRV